MECYGIPSLIAMGEPSSVSASVFSLDLHREALLNFLVMLVSLSPACSYGLGEFCVLSVLPRDIIIWRVFWLHIVYVHSTSLSFLPQFCPFGIGHCLFMSLGPCLEKAMATHSSDLAWRIPGKVEPGGLPSMGSHRVEHNWSDLAAGPC